MTSSEIIGMTQAYQMGNYSRNPVVFVRGEGTRLFDVDGREYLDFLGGIAVTLLGHAHPGVSQAVSLQVKNLVHVSNLFHVPVQAELGRLVSASTTGGKVFFCNSGTRITSYNVCYTKLLRSCVSTVEMSAPLVRSVSAIKARIVIAAHDSTEPQRNNFV